MTLARELPPHQEGACEGSRGHTQGQREPGDQREVSRSFLEAAMSPWSLKDTPELRGRGRRRWHWGGWAGSGEAAKDSGWREQEGRASRAGPEQALNARPSVRLFSVEVLKFWSNEQVNEGMSDTVCLQTVCRHVL